MTDRERTHATAEELGYEAGAAAAEIRIELEAAGREALEAVRSAMEEARRALREARRATAGEAGPASGDQTAGSPAGPAERATRAQRKELTRELLLDAAAEVFSQKGYHGASLDDVADAAGFTKGAVYSNFATKADLFMALIERHARDRNRSLGQALRDLPLDRLPGYLEARLHSQVEEEREWDVLSVEIWLAAMRDPVIRERLVAARAQAMTELGAIVDQKLAASGRRSELGGRDLVDLVDALGTGFLMGRYLDPAKPRPDLLAIGIRKLLAG